MRREDVTAFEIGKVLIAGLCEKCECNHQPIKCCRGCLAAYADEQARWLETQRDITAKERGE